jgi:hypothetical protein
MRFLIILILAVTIVSCEEPKMLQKSLKEFSAPIGYLHDSKMSDSIKVDSLSITFNNFPLDSITTVKKINRMLLPFLIFNYYEVNMGVKLGQKSIQQPYYNFFVRSFIEESKRSGNFGIVSLDDTHYSLEITIDSCLTRSKYKRTNMIVFYMLGYIMSYNERGFPAETNLYVSTKLRKGKDILAEKSYSIYNSQPFIVHQYNNDLKRLRFDFTTNMVESLSLGTKDCIEKIIGDVNAFLSENSNKNRNEVRFSPFSTPTPI